MVGEEYKKYVDELHQRILPLMEIAARANNKNGKGVIDG